MNSMTADLHAGIAPTSPEEIYAYFQERAATGDVEALLDLYEPECTVVPQPGQVASGRAEVAAALRGFLAALTNFRVELRKSYVVGDIALVAGAWSATATMPDGTQMPIAGSDGVVLRRQADGTWRMVIDDANFIA